MSEDRKILVAVSAVIGKVYDKFDNYIFSQRRRERKEEKIMKISWLFPLRSLRLCVRCPLCRAS